MLGQTSAIASKKRIERAYSFKHVHHFCLTTPLSTQPLEPPCMKTLGSLVNNWLSQHGAVDGELVPLQCIPHQDGPVISQQLDDVICRAPHGLHSKPSADLARKRNASGMRCHPLEASSGRYPAADGGVFIQIGSRDWMLLLQPSQ